jgi:hypothetical protein
MSYGEKNDHGKDMRGTILGGLGTQDMATKQPMSNINTYHLYLFHLEAAYARYEAFKFCT